MSHRLIMAGVLAVATAGHFCSPAADAETAHAATGPETALVFLLAGQSNMAGLGKASTLPPEYRSPPKNVLLFEEGKWRALTPAPRPSGDGSFGPEISFGHELAAAFPDHTIILVKHARGGSALAMSWNPERPGKLYEQLVAHYHTAVKDRPHRVAGVLFSQGGGDAKQEEAANPYGARLQALIERLRRDLNAPGLPFIFSGSGPEDPVSAAYAAQFPFFKTIRAGYVHVAQTVPQTKMISGWGISYGPDGIHFDGPGQIEFGRRFARGFLELTEKK